MKLLFVNDHIFLRFQGKIYSDKFSYDILSRYLIVFDTMTVVSRVREVDNIGDTILAEGKGVVFCSMPSISSLKSFLGQRKDVKKQINEILINHDALIARLPSELGFISCDLAEKNKIKYAVEIVGCGWEAYWFYGNLKAKIYSFYIYSKMKFIIGKSKNSLYVTESFLQKRYPSHKLANIESVSNVELMKTEDYVLDSRVKKINKEINKKIFGTIGSLKTNYKGIHLAIRALSEVGFDFEYRILGDGILIKKYKMLSKELNIENKVVFEGVIAEREMVLKWLDNIDIYLQPSLTEGLPRALIEAMSRGCPSVGSDAGGITDLLNNQCIFEVNNYVKLKKIINEISFDKSQLLFLAKENFEESKKYHKDILEDKRTKFLMNLKN